MPYSSPRAQALQQLETQLTTLAENICDAWIMLSDAIDSETSPWDARVSGAATYL
jgi:hypothetical protein